MDDSELVRAICRGDVHAVTVLFDRHGPQVHDLALAVLRDRQVAAEVVEATFEEALPRLRGLQEEHRLVVWLLAVTRRHVARRAGPTAGADRRPLPSGTDEKRDRLAVLVWEAVADLPVRERALIDLRLRQGLEGQDLADALGVPRADGQALEQRMRNQIEAGLVGYLIDRATEGHCPALTKALRGWDGRFTTEGSARIADHVEGCVTCYQYRFELPSPFALYQEAPAPPLPSSIRRPSRARLVLRLTDAAPGGPPPPSTPPTESLVFAPGGDDSPQRTPAGPAAPARAVPPPEAAP